MSDALFETAGSLFAEPQLLDLFMLAGWYHAINYTARAAAVALEPDAPRFTDYP